jgi:probable rRNA maturation factor
MSPRAQRAADLGIDIVVQSADWKQQPKAAATLRRAIKGAAAATSTAGGELAIVLTDDSAIRELNREWRGYDKATNVLSFPAKHPAPGVGTPLGDIVIAYQTAAREAEDEGKPFLDHLSHLAVHGFLHLLGYDHENDADAESMESLEIDILNRLNVPDPYAGRGIEA